MFWRESAHAFIGEQLRQKLRQRSARVSVRDLVLLTGGCVEIRIDKLDCLVHALGRENAAGQRVEEAFGDFPTIRFRDQRGIGCLNRAPDRAMIKPLAHQFARSMGQTVKDKRIKPEPFARILETAAPVAPEKTVACAPRDLVEMPLVFDNSITRCFRAKRGEATIGQGAGFGRHKVSRARSTTAATDRKLY